MFVSGSDKKVNGGGTPIVFVVDYDKVAKRVRKLTNVRISGKKVNERDSPTVFVFGSGKSFSDARSPTRFCIWR